MHASVRTAFATFTKAFETRVPWMYLGADALVMVAAGTAVDSVDAVTSLPFVHKIDQRAATPDEIRAEWELLKSRPELAQKGYRACEAITSLRLTEATMDELAVAKLEVREPVLERIFPSGTPAGGRSTRRAVAGRSPGRRIPRAVAGVHERRPGTRLDRGGVRQHDHRSRERRHRGSQSRCCRAVRQCRRGPAQRVGPGHALLSRRRRATRAPTRLVLAFGGTDTAGDIAGIRRHPARRPDRRRYRFAEVAQAATPATTTLRLWPAGQGQITWVQSGAPVPSGSCDFVVLEGDRPILEAFATTPARSRSWSACR